MPSTSWRETPAPDENARFEEYASALRSLQRGNAGGGTASRALHAKGHGYRAELEVLDGIPEHCKVAVFSAKKTYRAYVRFSNGAGRRQSDRKGDVRGLAVKVLGVGGRKIIPGLEDASTQDFLLIQSPSTPFRGPDEFVRFVQAAAGSPLLLLPRLFGIFGVGRTFRLVKGLAESTKPPASLATQPFYSALPIRFGAHAARYSLLPRDAAPATAPLASPDGLREELEARLKRGPSTYDFRVQFFVDEATTPIEDASVDWPESAAPWVTIARLVLPKQDASSEDGRRVATVVESLSFDPWHAAEELRPLGAMMRARNVAYRESTAERGAAKEPADGELPSKA
jgi:hypothetical protein